MFEFHEFQSWYEAHAKHCLEPARLSCRNALNTYLDQELQGFERVRVRVAEGRVKSEARLWRKLSEKYPDQAATTSVIPDVVDDLVGLRIVCTNGSDVERVKDLLIALPAWSPGDEPILAREVASEHDYILKPKKSGYRAFHINVVVAVDVGLTRQMIRCEIQVRTLLQDSWGELTHEDTYKPGAVQSDFVTTLSLRMADLLAALDLLAEDLRGELDRLAAEIVDDDEVGQEQPDVAAGPPDPSDPSLALLMRDYLVQRMEALDQPIDLASLAWELRREFGSELSPGWLGYGTFKNLIRGMLPEARLAEEPPGMLLPAGYAPEHHSLAEIPTPTPWPRPVVVLKTADPSFPSLSSDQWHDLFRILATAMTEFHWEVSSDLRALNEVTRRCREIASDTGSPMPRKVFDYVAKALRFRGRFVPDVEAEEIASVFADSALNRLRSIAPTLAETDETALRAWLSA